MTSKKIYAFLVSTADMIKDHNSDAAYILDALAGSVLCHDDAEMRRVVQAWIANRPEMKPR